MTTTPGTSEPAKIEIIQSGLPRPEGVSKPSGFDIEAKQLFSDKAPRARSLAELSSEYVLFTHALLFTHGKWPFDPIAIYLDENPKAAKPIVIDLPAPAFKGLSPATDCRLLAVPKEEWVPLFGYLASVSAIDHRKKLFHTLAWQEVTIPDTLENSHYPHSEVKCFGIAILGNLWTIGFAPEKRKKKFEPVPLVKYMPDFKIVRYGEALFVGSSKPMSGTLEARHEEAIKAAQPGLTR